MTTFHQPSKALLGHRTDVRLVDSKAYVQLLVTKVPCAGGVGLQAKLPRPCMIAADILQSHVDRTLLLACMLPGPGYTRFSKRKIEDCCEG